MFLHIVLGLILGSVLALTLKWIEEPHALGTLKEPLLVFFLSLKKPIFMI